MKRFPPILGLQVKKEKVCVCGGGGVQAGGGPTLGPILRSLYRGQKRGVRTPCPPPRSASGIGKIGKIGYNFSGGSGGGNGVYPPPPPCRCFVFVCQFHSLKFLRTCLFEHPPPLKKFLDPPRNLASYIDAYDIRERGRTQLEHHDLCYKSPSCHRAAHL